MPAFNTHPLAREKVPTTWMVWTEDCHEEHHDADAGAAATASGAARPASWVKCRVRSKQCAVPSSAGVSPLSTRAVVNAWAANTCLSPQLGPGGVVCAFSSEAAPIAQENLIDHLPSREASPAPAEPCGPVAPITTLRSISRGGRTSRSSPKRSKSRRSASIRAGAPGRSSPSFKVKRTAVSLPKHVGPNPMKKQLAQARDLADQLARKRQEALRCASRTSLLAKVAHEQLVRARFQMRHHTHKMHGAVSQQRSTARATAVSSRRPSEGGDNSGCCAPACEHVGKHHNQMEALSCESAPLELLIKHPAFAVTTQPEIESGQEIHQQHEEVPELDVIDLHAGNEEGARLGGGKLGEAEALGATEAPASGCPLQHGSDCFSSTRRPRMWGQTGPAVVGGASLSIFVCSPRLVGKPLAPGSSGNQ